MTGPNTAGPLLISYIVVGILLGLAQAHGNRADHRGNDQQQGEFGEGAVGE
ncbi:hypothetical protein [Stutzerimonas kunmingensis]|uniref:hypothetical protein n=1 Tax=Stutzerimonas kunmingensis TaxID=1211807 RepID=UPI00241F131F|nr:hypothetical protein [Stutzerimonas kunmingensis]